MLTYGPAVLIIFSVFFGILMGRRDINALKLDLKEDINRRFTEAAAENGRQFAEVNRRLTKLEADYIEFCGMERSWKAV